MIMVHWSTSTFCYLIWILPPLSSPSFNVQLHIFLFLSTAYAPGKAWCHWHHIPDDVIWSVFHFWLGCRDSECFLKGKHLLIRRIPQVKLLQCAMKWSELCQIRWQIWMHSWPGLWVTPLLSHLWQKSLLPLCLLLHLSSLWLLVVNAFVLFSNQQWDATGTTI